MALHHDDLKSMGIASVGHRLTMLKSVYDVKKAQDIPVESDHYQPLCTSLPKLGLEPISIASNPRSQLPMPKHSMRQPL